MIALALQIADVVIGHDVLEKTAHHGLHVPHPKVTIFFCSSLGCCACRSPTILLALGLVRHPDHEQVAVL